MNLVYSPVGALPSEFQLYSSLQLGFLFACLSWLKVLTCENPPCAQEQTVKLPLKFPQRMVTVISSQGNSVWLRVQLETMGTIVRLTHIFKGVSYPFFCLILKITPGGWHGCHCYSGTEAEMRGHRVRVRK